MWGVAGIYVAAEPADHPLADGQTGGAGGVCADCCGVVTAWALSSNPPGGLASGATDFSVYGARGIDPKSITYSVGMAARKLYWRLFCLFSICLGLIGIVVPGLPTVPFMILAAWAASKGWPALETRLLNHARYGPYIMRWREQGAIPRRAKMMSGIMMAASLGVLIYMDINRWLILGTALTMVIVFLWMLSRPE